MVERAATGEVDLRPWPVYRNNLLDFLEHSKRLHHVTGSWESDITRTEAELRRIQRETRTAISFNAYLIYVIARTVVDFPEIQSVRVPFRRRVAMFDGVDLGTAVEQRIGDGRSIAVPYTVRNADRKSLAAIHFEMRQASKSNLFASDPDILWRGRLAHLPGPVRRLVWKWVDFDPARRRRIRGTFGLTNLNFLGQGVDRPAFAYPMSLLTTGICVGSTYDRLVPDAEDPRGFRTSRRLCLTIQSNHDVVDGAPISRFVRRFNANLEAGVGLDETLVEELRARQPARSASIP